MNKRAEWLLQPSALFFINTLVKSPLPNKIIEQYGAPGTVTSSWSYNWQITLIDTASSVDPMWYWKSLRPVLP